jgi:hypothetical protein
MVTALDFVIASKGCDPEPLWINRIKMDGHAAILPSVARAWSKDAVAV